MSEEYDQTELKFECNSQQFLVRRYRLGDEEALVKHANNEKVSAHLRNQFPFPYTRDCADFFFNMDNKRVLYRLKETDPKDPMMRKYQHELFTVVHIADDGKEELFGGIGFDFLEDIYCRTAEIGYWMGEEYWGKGIMSEVVKVVVKFAQDKYVNGPLGNCLDKLKAEVFHTNKGSCRVLEHNGFECEGVLKKGAFKRGKTYDLLQYGRIFEPKS
jgi:ribosomal-protein-alanine N-acetyltransferase